MWPKELEGKEKVAGSTSRSLSKSRTVREEGALGALRMAKPLVGAGGHPTAVGKKATFKGSVTKVLKAAGALEEGGGMLLPIATRTAKFALHPCIEGFTAPTLRTLPVRRATLIAVDL